MAVAGNTQLQMQMTYYNGEVDTFTSSASWSSSDTSIATVGNGSTAGLTAGVSAGSMDMYASLSGIPTTTGEVCDPSGYCPSSDPEGTAGGTATPTVSISGSFITVPLRTGNSTGPNQMTLTATGSPSGGKYSWSVSGSKVSLTGTTSATVTVTSVAASQSVGDVPITVTYTVNGESGTQTTNITVEQPTSLSVVGTPTMNPTGHTCVSGTGTNTCSESYFPGGSGSYTSYVYTRTYHIMDQFNPPNWIQGYALQIQESYTAPTGQCTGPPVSTGGGSGDTIIDCFYYCSATCKSGGSCTESSTQTATVNGFTVATKSVSWTCTGVTVTP